MVMGACMQLGSWAFAVAALISLLATSAPARAMPLAIVDVTVIDIDAADAASALKPDQTVVMEGDRIIAVGAARTLHAPRGSRVVPGRGRFLIPGLWDAHAHLVLAGDAALPLYLANGVTSIRDMGGDLARLRAMQLGAEPRPTLYLSGPVIEGDWWLDAVAKAAETLPVFKTYPFLSMTPRLRLAKAEDAAGLVDRLQRERVDQIKFRNLRKAAFLALAASARARGMRLTGHAPADIGIGEAAEAGLSSIEHMDTVSESLGDAPDLERRAQFDRMARAGTSLTPTLVTTIAYRITPDARAYAVISDTANHLDPRRRFLSRDMLAAWKFGLDIKQLEGPTPDGFWAKAFDREVADLKLAHSAHVPLMVGTDLGVSLIYPGYSVHEEMQALVTYGGLTPLEALRAATLTPAAVITGDPAAGRIAPGAVANLVLLARDPLGDIRAAADIDAVVVAGRLLGRSDLRALEQRAQALAVRSKASPAH